MQENPEKYSRYPYTNYRVIPYIIRVVIWLDDSLIDYSCPKWKGVKSSLEQKGVIYWEEDDLYAINPKYDELFE